MHMVKVQHALLGIFSLFIIATSSLNVVSLTTTATTTTTTAAPPPYPACDTLASYAYAFKPKGQAIDMYGPKSQKFNSNNQTTWADWYRAGDAKKGWSKWSFDDQNAFLSGTLVYLFIDGKPVSIKTDICYDKDGKFFKKKTPDSVYKISYLVIAPGTYAGKHYFCLVGFWNGEYDRTTGTKYVTITFK